MSDADTEINVTPDLPRRGIGKRQFPHLCNIKSTAIFRSNARRYMPHGYSEDAFRPHVRPVAPNYTDIGPDWTSQLRYLGSPRDGESTKFAEVWPEAWKCIRTFPDHHYQTRNYWIVHPDGNNVGTRCMFDGVHKATELSTEEVAMFSIPKYLADRRNNIPVATPGDKSYPSVEYSPDFFKFGATVPLVDFGRPSKQPADIFILPMESTGQHW